MADETQAATTGQTQATTDQAVQTPATTGDATGAQAQTAEAAKTFTQADLDRIVQERLQRAQVKTQEAAQKAAAAAEAKVLAEQGEYQKLYEKLQAENTAAQARIRTMELDALRSAVGRRLALPDALHSRLQGEDEAAIEADAKTLLAALPKPTAPNINAVAGTGATDAQVVAAQAQEIAAIYGVNPKYMQAS